MIHEVRTRNLENVKPITSLDWIHDSEAREDGAVEDNGPKAWQKSG